jgi:integrase/recombinase XerD
MNGGALASLSSLLGHSNVLITQEYYSIFTIEQLQQKHERHSPVAQMFGGDNDDHPW